MSNAVVNPSESTRGVAADRVTTPTIPVGDCLVKGPPNMFNFERFAGLIGWKPEQNVCPVIFCDGFMLENAEGTFDNMPFTPTVDGNGNVVLTFAGVVPVRRDGAKGRESIRHPVTMIVKRGENGEPDVTFNGWLRDVVIDVSGETTTFLKAPFSMFPDELKKRILESIGDQAKAAREKAAELERKQAEIEAWLATNGHLLQGK